MEKDQLYKPYEEQRKYPRIIINCPVNVGFKGKDFRAMLYDLSPDGLQIRCDRNTLKAIHPSGAFIKKETAPVLDVAFSLLVRNNNRQIGATGAMYYFVLLPDDEGVEVAIGMQFKSFKGRSSKYIDEFIEDALTPIENRILSVLTVPRSISEIAELIGTKIQDVDGILPKLIYDREVISIGFGKDRKHVRLVSAITNMIDNFADLEKRLTSLEQNMEGKKK